jgi:uncharacterized protein
MDLNKITGFDWDSGNIHKSYQKHGITPNQAEKVFLDPRFQYQVNLTHSKNEQRYFGIGRLKNKQWLFVSFTFRKNKIRVISARRIHKKERRKYEK